MRKPKVNPFERFTCAECGEKKMFPHTHCMGCGTKVPVYSEGPDGEYPLVFKKVYCYACRKKYINYIRRGR